MMLLWERTTRPSGSSARGWRWTPARCRPCSSGSPPPGWSPATAGSRTSARSPSRSPTPVARCRRGRRISQEMIGAIGFDTEEFAELKDRLRILIERVNSGEAVC